MATEDGSVYQRYGLRHFHGDVQGIGAVDRGALERDRGEYGPLFGPVLHLLNEQGEVGGQLGVAAQGLRDGIATRSAPAAAHVVYETLSHQTLYDSVTQGVDPGAVGEVSDTWLGMGNKLADLQDTVARAISDSQVTWTGPAAEQARQSIAKLGNQAGDAGQSAQLAGVLTAQQAEALSSAKTRVPPPVPAFNAAAAAQQLQTIQDPVAFAAQAATDQARAGVAQAAHLEAARVVREYDQTVAQTSSTMPAFAPAPHVVQPGGQGSVAVPHIPRSIGGSPGGVGSHPRVGGAASRVPGSAAVAGPGSRQAAGIPGAASDLGGSVLPSGFTPTSPSGAPLPGSAETSGGAGTIGVPGGLRIGFESVGAPPSNGGPAGYLLPPGDGFGLPHSGGSRGIGEPRSGLGNAERVAAREAAAVEGRGGATPIGALGAGRGQRGQEDSVHQRPAWLVETDKGIFGTDEVTAPPVIGDD